MGIFVVIDKPRVKSCLDLYPPLTFLEHKTTKVEKNHFFNTSTDNGHLDPAFLSLDKGFINLMIILVQII